MISFIYIHRKGHYGQSFGYLLNLVKNFHCFCLLTYLVCFFFRDSDMYKIKAFFFLYQNALAAQAYVVIIGIELG